MKQQAEGTSHLSWLSKPVHHVVPVTVACMFNDVFQLQNEWRAVSPMQGQ